MKITRRQLRRLIEMAWDPKLSPYVHPGKVYHSKSPKLTKRSRYYQNFLEDKYSKDELRSLGLLSYDDSEKEKQILRDYHEANVEEIKKFYAELSKHPEFSRVTCLHSIDYEGMSTNKKEESLGEWIKMYGNNNRDQLSTVMFPCSVTDLHKYFSGGFKKTSRFSNASQVMKNTSLIMKGYPVIMSTFDMMTQTVGNLHPELVQFQRGSGVSKSAGKTPDIDNFQDFLKGNVVSEETVLDNWGIKGVHHTFSDINVNPNSRAVGELVQSEKERMESVVEDCRRLNLPLWVTYLSSITTKRVF